MERRNSRHFNRKDLYYWHVYAGYYLVVDSRLAPVGLCKPCPKGAEWLLEPEVSLLFNGDFSSVRKMEKSVRRHILDGKSYEEAFRLLKYSYLLRGNSTTDSVQE